MGGISRVGLAIPIATTKILARTAIARVALAIPGRATGKFVVAAEFSFRPIAARGVRSLLTAALAWRIWPLVAEFLVGKARGRTALSALAARRAVVAVIVRAIAPRRVGPLFAIAAGTVIPVEARRTWRVSVVAARRSAFAFAGVRFACARIGLLAKRLGVIAPAGIRAFFALTLAGKTAFGEFLFRSPRSAGAALAAGRPIAPAAGIVVFVVIAGHQRSLVCR